jgi:23S rRNA pseudouridine1911/1915/1917 synthase
MFRPGSVVTLIVLQSDDGNRIDTVVSAMLGCSRTLIQEFIALGVITLDAKVVKKNSVPVNTDQQIIIAIPKLCDADQKDASSGSLLDSVVVCAQEDDFIIVNKPAGLVVHAPNRKNTEPSLVDWLTLNGYQQGFEGLSVRPGIVHRLDKETSGIMIIAKNRMAQAILSDLFKARTIQKKYYAVVHGDMPAQMQVDSFLIRDPISHIKMASIPYSYHSDVMAVQSGLRRAVSDIKKIKQFLNHSFIEVSPLTGRTHQIRVHCTSVGYPIVGDALYGQKSPLIDRHALHAFSLSFDYKGTSFYYEVPMPDDFNKLLASL